jgi:hypothetical protein
MELFGVEVLPMRRLPEFNPSKPGTGVNGSFYGEF